MQFFAGALLSLALFCAVQAVDDRREVNTLQPFCTLWNDKCIALAHRDGKAYSTCDAGTDGGETARVNCYALTNDVATDYVDQTAKALNISFV